MRRAAATLLAVPALLVVACQGATRLDLTTLGRGTWQRPGDVVEALELAPGDRVADLGAGAGYFVSHLAEAVGPSGRVYAVDVDAEIVGALETRFAGQRNVEPLLAELDDAGLPDASVDLVLIVNTYHHIHDRPVYFRRLRADLRPGGRVAVIDMNEDLGGVLSLAVDAGHASSASAVEQEMRAAGYRLETRHDFLPVQIFQIYTPDA